MPHGNQAKKRPNPKKKGNKGGGNNNNNNNNNRVGPQAGAAGNVGPQQYTSYATSSGGGPSAPKRPNLPSLTTFRSVEETTENGPKSSNGSNTAKDSIYVRYKKTTQRFKDALQSLVPPEIFATDSVNALMEATDYIVEKKLAVDAQLLSDLKFTIRVRQRIAQDKYSGGDEGHAHFIAVLVYCWSHLQSLQRQRQFQPLQPRRRHVAYANFAAVATTVASSDDPAASLPNRFEHLTTADDETSTEMEDEDDDDDDDDTNDLPQQPQPRPQPVRTPLTLQELIAGTDRTNIILFLMTLGELMSFNALQFSKLKEASEWIQKEGYPASILVEQMIEASVACNLSIQQVASLEQVFIHDNPHLNTVYRVFANLVLVDLVRHLTSIVAAKSPIASQFTERRAVEFLGDAMECAFRNPSDPNNKVRTLVPEFLQRWQFKDDAVVALESGEDKSVQLVFDGVQAVTRLEVALQREQGGYLNLLSSFIGMSGHSWLRDEYIGKNRSITHTIRQLQGLSNLVKERHGRLISRRGFFGTSWSDRRKPATRMQIDMDELLMADVLPSLINMCYEGMMSMDTIPFQDEIFTGFVQIKTFVKYPERPVSWSLAFTVHTILTSIFEVQGSNHAAFLADTARGTFEKYIRQLEWAEKQPLTTIARRPPIWDANVKSLQALRYLVHVGMERTREQTMLSLWNPFCAGSFLSYIAFYGNLEGGTSLVDSVAQLRMTLHLFNALLQAGAMQPGQIEVLDGIFQSFKTCKAIWEGPLPSKGQYQTRWWIAFGMKARLARRMNGQASRSGNPASSKNEDPNREMTPIELEHLSKSYRRVCLRDFRGVVDNYHNEHQRSKKDEPLYKHAVRVNDTLDAITEDSQLLATNLISLGFYLNQFYISLFNVWGWTAQIEQIVRETPIEIKQDRRTDFRRVSPKSWEASDENMKYQCMSHMFAEKVLGALDRGDALVASRCAEFMLAFFDSIPPDNVMWFTPTVLED